jgi:hypothetical protein
VTRAERGSAREDVRGLGGDGGDGGVAVGGGGCRSLERGFGLSVELGAAGRGGRNGRENVDLEDRGARPGKSDWGRLAGG